MATEPEAFEDLLQKARGGDARASARLFDRLAGAGEEAQVLLKMARGILPRGDRLRDFVESRDLLQSALKSGWLDLADFRGETPKEFLGWIRAILRRKLGRVARRRLPRPGGAIVEEMEPAAAGSAELPLASVIREEAKARVRAAVASLPERERQVMEMRLRGLNATEVAEITGLDPAAVRKRESRAAERLRALLKEDAAGGVSS